MINKKQIILFSVFVLLLTSNIYSMTAKEFYTNWVNFIIQKVISKQNWMNYYNDNKSWTELTIGTKQSEKINSPLGDFIKNKTALRYRKEDGLTDLSFASNYSFDNVYTLHQNQVDRAKVITDSVYYPSFYEILIEHENDIYNCYEEMVKLTYDRARLKVLITYNENVDDTSDYKFANNILIANFSTIIKQANNKYPENNETEYLFIIGQIENSKLVWYSYIFDYNGNVK